MRKVSCYFHIVDIEEHKMLMDLNNLQKNSLSRRRRVSKSARDTIKTTSYEGMAKSLKWSILSLQR
jgi:hypothetical protein